MNQNYDQWIDRDVYDCDGERIGAVRDVFYDDASQRPEWVTVTTGLFGLKSSFVPIGGSTPTSDGALRVPFTKDQVKDAPRVDAGMAPSASDERELWEHYGYDYSKYEGDYGYGKDYAKAERADRDFTYSRYDNESQDWGEQRRLQEHTETVPVSAKVEVPIETTVRLRRYETQQTKQVTVPVTETEEHVEVEGVEGKAKTSTRQ